MLLSNHSRSFWLQHETRLQSFGLLISLSFVFYDLHLAHTDIFKRVSQTHEICVHKQEQMLTTGNSCSSIAQAHLQQQVILQLTCKICCLSIICNSCKHAVCISFYIFRIFPEVMSSLFIYFFKYTLILAETEKLKHYSLAVLQT